MIEFKKFEGTSEITELGTIAEQIGAKGTAMFSKKNFASDKRVVVIAGNDKGESAVISCSTPLSAQLRKLKTEGVDKNELLAMVIEMPLYENEIGAFIGLPAGERTEVKTIAELKKVKKSAKAVLNLEELVW